MNITMNKDTAALVLKVIAIAILSALAVYFLSSGPSLIEILDNPNF